MDNMEEGLVLVDHVADVNTSAAPRSVSNAQESQIMAFYLSMADGQVAHPGQPLPTACVTTCSTTSSSSSSWSPRNKGEWSRNISPESNNSSQKSFQFCRICHEGDGGSCSSGISSNSSQGSLVNRREPLIAPCHCTGSVAMVHLSCLEHWLTTSNREKCELCNFLYKTKKMPRTWTEFLTDSDNQFNVRNMIADLICFFLLTPLLVISTYLCCLGAHQYYIRERWEAIGLITLSVFLLAVYFTWCHVTLKYHFGVWQTWQRTHQRVSISLEDSSNACFSRYFIME